MKIILNNEPLSIENADELTIQQILELKKYSFRLLVIKVNGKLIAKDQYQRHFVKDGDDVMILHLMSGG